MIRHLLRPFSYLSIEHELKKKVDWNYPCSLSIISTGLAFWLQQFAHISLYADSGMISKILNFVQVLPGFYIAALAAIATFNRIDIDKIMPSPAPKIGMFIQGNNVVIELTSACTKSHFFKNALLNLMNYFLNFDSASLKTHQLLRVLLVQCRFSTF
ncbi:hypothetical protein bplSymb_SCF02805P001 [Bathymodiolus platifrons methanotrophic gill symbiont]|uniref:hypothetical protein n=1 Tax=Bathymodiolus platifrons methanotrophic gill symbiont TaxID=113268 RepID=UPI000B415346|nr:hypothetical protein [Bathymodiolus platifrons methanotrophic gill symbiont]GAW86486.1 hypothetical protein bplSymb_SCF02805P001 [Bathymodiolus platifrons methanotrophic gill symbiont]